MISVILPVFNESNHGYLVKIVHSLNRHSGIEKIAIDGGSSDVTVDILKQGGFRVVSLSPSSRASRIRRGIELARGNMILLHHPRSVLSLAALDWLKKHEGDVIWGGFHHKFDHHHWLLRFTSWYSNSVRARRGILYLDHCIFFHRSLLSSPDLIPDVEIFEDTEISKILRKVGGLPIVVDKDSTTSAVRFLKNGIIRQAVLNQKMKLMYFLGRSHQKMNQEYEKNLNLNN